MFCTKCGNNNPDGAFCCTSCGAPLNQPQAPQQPAYQAPEQPVYQAPEQPVYQAPEQPAYQAQPMYNAPVNPPVPAKGMAITSMVLGIVSLALFCLWYLALPCAIVGLILGGLAMNKAKAVGMKSGMAVAGIVCSCIALGIAIIVMIIGIATCSAATSALDSYYYYY